MIWADSSPIRANYCPIEVDVRDYYLSDAAIEKALVDEEIPITKLIVDYPFVEKHSIPMLAQVFLKRNVNGSSLI